MGKKLDLTNQRFGKLVVIKYSHNNKYGTQVWLCKCDCGNQCYVITGNLTINHIISCGCTKTLDLIGKQFGLLTVVALSHSDKSKQRVWMAKCVCGNMINITTHTLNSIKNPSCGCYYKNRIPKKNLIGQTFGSLTVIQFVKRTRWYYHIWKCQCKCGNIKNVFGHNLIQGKVFSCGCEIKYHNLVGQTFGHLVVESFSHMNKYNGRVWKTKCQCGNIVYKSTQELRLRKNLSCGCIPRQYNASLDLSNKKFGTLRPIKRLYKSKNNTWIWECLCDCGNIKYILSSSLIRHNYHLCNCTKFVRSKRCSCQQRNIYTLLGKGVLNFPTKSGYFIDIAFLDNKQKMGIEYEGMHWHNQINFKRHNKLKQDGWKILYIVSQKFVPTKKELDLAIKKLQSGKESYNIMYLKDANNDNR